MAASPRISNWPPERGSASGRCAPSFSSHCAPYLREIVVAGHDRDEVTALIFPNVEACRELVPGGSDIDVVRSERVRAKFHKLLQELAKESTGSSNRVVRALLMEEPPSIDKHEITDKGSFNQARRAAESRRAGGGAVRGGAFAGRTHDLEHTT